MRFESAVITGAGSGIGRALAVYLAGTGCRVVLADIDAAAVQGAAGETGGTAVPMDVADPAAVQALAAAAGVAAAAVSAAAQGRFAVVPPQWHTAVMAGSQSFVTRHPPTPPTPTR